nr:DEAD/DEAH box helicase family protein [Corynebacterium phoceense]
MHYYLEFAAGSPVYDQAQESEDYVLRPEQKAAVEQALSAFDHGHEEVLWNAKPRFGKTLTSYDLARKLDARYILIVTNRPAIANSWFDDFARFIAHQTDFKFVSESSSLRERTPLTRDQWTSMVLESEDPIGLIEFVSLQDLKGSQYFGGPFDKLHHIAEMNWDLLVVDEAHEGVDTLKTDVAFEHIKRKFTLHLSGTPFRALSSGKFSNEQIFNWTYVDEREARENWSDTGRDNPYAPLPALNMLTYQMSRMISDRLTEGVALEEDSADIDYAFDLNEFFSTKENGFFVHEPDVVKFLDTLTTNEKYPFSTPALQDEIRHSFWLLDRVASAQALAKLLRNHPAFEDYEVVVAAGDGRSSDSDEAVTMKSFDRVRAAIDKAEKVGGKTITLSVGQLTTGVTIPEWTAVIMLSNMASPALYMQAAFRAQNPCTFERNGVVYQKQNSYIFDFAPERTLTIYDSFANDLYSSGTKSYETRSENIRRLLNFFPVIGEDSEGKMVELDASQVLTFPQVFKAREIVRRGFLSNLLFTNIGGIFQNSKYFEDIIDKLPKANEKNPKKEKFSVPDNVPNVDSDGNVVLDPEIEIAPKVKELGKPVWHIEDVKPVPRDAKTAIVAKQLAELVEQKMSDTRKAQQAEYGLTKTQIARDEKATAEKVRLAVERSMSERNIASKTLENERAQAATEAEAEELDKKQDELDQQFQTELLEAISAITDEAAEEVVSREEHKREQKSVNSVMDDVRAHLRGFARTIPMFLMAYGARDTTLANFDDYTPDDVFHEITGITEADFRKLRDGGEAHEPDGTVTKFPGLFDALVFDQSIQEFLDKKEALADYFDESLTENIFAYIPPQKTSLVFTPDPVVRMMVDEIENDEPGIFNDPNKTFADLFSTAGLFLMELVRRLNKGLEDVIEDPDERLERILSKQLFEMSHNEILHAITIEAVSGGLPERKRWMEQSGHFRVGNIGEIPAEERDKIVDQMLEESN